MNIMSIIGKVAQMSKLVQNPKQAFNLAIQALQKKSPQAAQLINSAIKSGKSPAEFAKEQAEKGNITEKNLGNLKQYYGIAKQMGLPSIPEAEWTEIENAIKNKGGSPINGQSASTGFNGF